MYNKEKARQYYREHREEYIARAEKWRKENPEKIKIIKKREKQKNKERYRKVNGIGEKNKRITDKYYYTNHRISLDISSQLRIDKGNKQWEKFIGYTYKDLVEHLESRFSKEMNGNNYGTYGEIDHIIPRCMFNLETVKDCWALSNLQPLEKIKNREKGNKMI